MWCRDIRSKMSHLSVLTCSVRCFHFPTCCLVTPGLVSSISALAHSSVQFVPTHCGTTAPPALSIQLIFIVGNSNTRVSALVKWRAGDIEGHHPDKDVPGSSGPLPARLHLWFPAPLLIQWEFQHPPWHHSKGGPQKDGWGLQRHRSL